VRLFSPEHGLSARGDDGAAIADDIDAVTGLPIVSLYGDRFEPPDLALRDLDYVLCDLPDVGARFYTFIWTLSLVLEACGRTGTPLVVLDRPNPLGGRLDLAEGPMLDVEHCASFLGRWRMPIRHALTIGELARHWAATQVRNATLQVIAGEGWKRAALWPELGLEWVPPSPAIPAFASALLYPGTCLFEGTNVSVGRGTEAPFQVVAAPWLDAQRVVRSLRGSVAAAVLDGLQLTPASVTPDCGPFAGEECRAVRITIADPHHVRPVAFGLTLLALIMHQHPDEFSWGAYPTASNPTGRDHLARLVGRVDIGAELSTGAHASRGRPADNMTSSIGRWTDTGSWPDEVAAALLYD
jgi:uncharacterized protein YbbC (DUF1343 family)